MSLKENVRVKLLVLVKLTGPGSQIPYAFA